MIRRILLSALCPAALVVALAMVSPAHLVAQTGDSTPTPAPATAPATPALPYRAIGDAFLAAGRPAQALEYYLKALDANPADAAALDAVRRVLADRPDDPRVALAEAYAAAGNHEAALALYAELLDAEQVDDGLRAAALESVEQTRLLPALARKTQTMAATDAATGIVKFLLNLLGAAVLLLLLLLLVRFIRRRRGRGSPPDRAIVVLPFTNATGADSLEGMEHGARAAVVAWLVANSAVANGRPIIPSGNAASDSVISDVPAVVSAEPFPDVGALGKFLNWVWQQTAPPRPMLIVDGTLLYRSNSREVGLALTARERPGGPVGRAWQTYASAPAGNEYVRIEELAAQGASWVREPGLTLSPIRAVGVLELNNRLILARAQLAAGDTTAALQTAQAAAGDDDGGGLESMDSGGLAGGAGQPAADSGYSEALARHREAQFSAFLDDLSRQSQPEGKP